MILKYIAKGLKAILASLSNMGIASIKALIAIPFLLLMAPLSGIYLLSKILFSTIDHLLNFKPFSALKTVLLTPLALLISLATPIITFEIIFMNLIESPIHGFLSGWNENFFPFQNIGASIYAPLNEVLNSLYAHSISSVHFINVLAYIVIVGNFFAHLFPSSTFKPSNASQSREGLRQQNNVPNFESYALTSEEQASIKNAQEHPLTSEDRALLSEIALCSIWGEKISGQIALEKYDSILRNLADKCPILQDHPERDDAILVQKQYQQNGVWKNVPLECNVFDKDSLKQWYDNAPNPTNVNRVKLKPHPIYKDSFVTPDPYGDYTTRYRYHPLYLNAQQDASSALLNELIVQIRFALASHQQSNVIHPKVTQRLQNNNHSYFNNWCGLFATETQESTPTDPEDNDHKPSCCF